MMYMKEGHKNDMFFACIDSHNNNDRGGFLIVKVFFNKRNCEKYIEEHTEIRGQKVITYVEAEVDILIIEGLEDNNNVSEPGAGTDATR